MWLESADTNCLCCLGIGTTSLRFDKRGRPYAVCFACGSRLFFKGRNGLRGQAILADVIAELATQAETDPTFAAHLRNKHETFLTQLAQRSAKPESLESGAALAMPGKENVA